MEEQLAVFIQAQSKSKDVQYNMEVAWEKERKEQKRLLNEAHALAMDLQVCYSYFKLSNPQISLLEMIP